MSVGDDEGELIAAELLARFPYHEHPSNLALVARLGEALGVPAVIALAEMADNVVPDLGVLRTYPTVEHADRRVSFVNGMSANERMGALSNWRRMGLDAHDPDATPERFVVTLVNNRADRLARSAVFAQLLVEDVGAHRHVLIGTNVSGLHTMIVRALERHLDNIDPTRDLEGSEAERRRLVLARTQAALARLHIVRLDDDAVRSALVALGIHAPGGWERCLCPRPDETYAAAKVEVAPVVAKMALDDAKRAYAIELFATRRSARALVAMLETPSFDEARYARAFRAFYRAVFLERVVALEDASLTGDQVIDAVARTAPPGAQVCVMGLQNIKGTGLDFVYRWVGIDEIERVVERTSRATSAAERTNVLRALRERTDMGAVEARHALVRLAGAGLPEDVHAFLRARAGASTVARARARAARSHRLVQWMRGLFGRTFDFADSILRRMKANALLDALARGAISHAELAVEMRKIHARQYGVWALGE